MTRPSVSVVVPVYGGEATLEPLVERLLSVLPETTARHEILLVDDASPDASARVIERLCAAHPEVIGIELARNAGQHAALLAGICQARFEIVVTLDDDLQNPPEEIPRLLSCLTFEKDVVYGVARELGHSAWRNVTSGLTKALLARVTGSPLVNRVSPFRAFRRELRDAFADHRGPAPSLDVLLSWATDRFTHVEVEHAPRTAGRSGYDVARLTTHALNMITGWTTLPLRLASFVGFAFTAFGGLVLAYVIGRWMIQGSVVPGFAFLASVITIFAGAQLFALGIIGEYVARMYGRSLAQPTYRVRRVIGRAPRPADPVTSATPTPERSEL